MSDNGLGYPISFGKTANLVVEGKKTSIRKTWGERYAQYFIKRYEREVPIAAFDKDRKSGGSLIGWLRLTEKPYLELLLEMPEKDVVAEGYPKYTKEQFIDKFFEGNALQAVWVIKFKFEPLKNSENSSGVLVRTNERSIADKDTSSISVEPKSARKAQAISLNGIDILEELTEEEQQDRLNLERQIERAFYIRLVRKLTKLSVSGFKVAIAKTRVNVKIRVRNSC